MGMKEEEFLAKLSEVALWKIPEREQETSANAKKKRGRKSAEELYQEQHEQVFLEMFEGVNPTQAPMLLKVHKACDCTDCGKHCPNGREMTYKRQTTNGKAHWRERCDTCGFCKDPYTEEFNIDGTKASIKWNSFLKDTKGAYQTAANLKRSEMIRKYPDTEDPL